MSGGGGREGRGTAWFRTQNPKPKTQNPKHQTPNRKPGRAAARLEMKAPFLMRMSAAAAFLSVCPLIFLELSNLLRPPTQPRAENPLRARPSQSRSDA